MTSTTAQETAKKTALVTGASAGLGKELARLFAADGHDVILAARGEDRLKALAAELSNVTAHVVSADLAAHDGAGKLFAEVERRGLSVDFLVNNAGFGSTGAFVELDVERELDMVQVNVASLVELTHRFGQSMRARGFGRILNIASLAGFVPGPFMATYYASKAFVVSFSEAVAYELAGTGVTVTCHCPGATATEFAQTAGNDKTKLFARNVADAVAVARHAYDAMMRGEVVAVPGVMNQLSMQSTRLAPRALLRRIAAGMNRPT